MSNSEIGLVSDSVESFDESGEPEWVMDNPQVTQHMVRSQQDGVDHVVAYFRLGFEAEQQRQILHIPFFPALNTVPKVEAHVTDQEGVRIRVTDVQKFGVRLEAIRSGNLLKNTAVIEVIASEVEAS